MALAPSSPDTRFVGSYDRAIGTAWRTINDKVINLCNAASRTQTHDLQSRSRREAGALVTDGFAEKEAMPINDRGYGTLNSINRRNRLKIERPR